MLDRGLPLWSISAIIGTFGACYALFGGLKAVAVSDCLNGTSDTWQRVFFKQFGGKPETPSQHRSVLLLSRFGLVFSQVFLFGELDESCVYML